MQNKYLSSPLQHQHAHGIILSLKNTLLESAVAGGGGAWVSHASQMKQVSYSHMSYRCSHHATRTPHLTWPTATPHLTWPTATPHLTWPTANPHLTWPTATRRTAHCTHPSPALPSLPTVCPLLPSRGAIAPLINLLCVTVSTVCLAAP